MVDRCAPALAPVSLTAALGHSPNLGSHQRFRCQQWIPNPQKQYRLSQRLCWHLRQGHNRKTIQTKTGVPSVKTEGSCSAATSALKCFTWRVTYLPSMSHPGTWQAVSLYFDTTQIKKKKNTKSILTLIISYHARSLVVFKKTNDLQMQKITKKVVLLRLD